ncbi:MAG: sugar transferase [Actinomycetota bacterium]
MAIISPESAAKPGATHAIAAIEPVERGSRLILRARLALDLSVLTAAVVLALVMRFRLGWLATEPGGFHAVGYATASCVWVGSFLLFAYGHRLYDEDTLFPGGGEVSRIAKALVAAVGIVSILAFLVSALSVSRGWFGLVAMLSLTLLAAERLLLRAGLRRVRSQGRLRRPALLVSNDSAAWSPWIGDRLGEFDVVERMSAKEAEAMLGSVPGEDGVIYPYRDAAVIVEAAGFEEDDLWRLVLLANRWGHAVYVRSPVRPVSADRLTMRELDGQTTVKVAPPALVGIRRLEKRAFDVVVSATVLLLSAPLFVILSAATIVASGWPVFYSQDRVGENERVFKIWKFRTMHRDAEKDSGPVWATAEDPRRTRIGRLLRRTSLDELPQLWNVLRGDMSVVGPRPERPPFVDRFSEEVPWYAYRHRIRPGITGWAQSHGLRGNTSLDPRVAFDNWYIENWSLVLDLKIIGKTVREMLRGRNAY